MIGSEGWSGETGMDRVDNACLLFCGLRPVIWGKGCFFIWLLAFGLDCPIGSSTGVGLSEDSMLCNLPFDSLGL